MRELVISKLEEIMNDILRDGGEGLETEPDVFFDDVEQLKELSDEELLEVYEYTFGFGG